MLKRSAAKAPVHPSMLAPLAPTHAALAPNMAAPDPAMGGYDVYQILAANMQMAALSGAQGTMAAHYGTGMPSAAEYGTATGVQQYGTGLAGAALGLGGQGNPGIGGFM